MLEFLREKGNALKSIFDKDEDKEEEKTEAIVDKAVRVFEAQEDYKPTEEQKKLIKIRWKKFLKIDDKYLLMCYANSDFEHIEDDNEYEVYQLILEAENDTIRYGIYANGILSESMSKKTFNKKKRMEMIL